MDVTTGVRENVQTFFWKIQNFIVVQEDENLVAEQKYQFHIEKTQGGRSTWLVGLRVVSNLIRVYFKLADLQGDISEIPVRYLVDIKKNDGSMHWNSGMGFRKIRKQEEFYDGQSFQFKVSNPQVTLVPYLDQQGALTYVVKIAVIQVTGTGNPSYPLEAIIEKFKKNSNDRIKKGLASILTTGNDSDTKIICCDGTELKAHKIILTAQCPVFESMFSSDMAENKEGVVDIKDVSGPTMKIILHYLYTGELLAEWNDPETIVEFIYAAGKYQLNEILGMLDGVLGKEDDNFTCSFELLKLVSKLSLKNAEDRIMQRVLKLANTAESSADLVSLFEKTN